MKQHGFTYQHGFSLIDGLIGAVVLAVGLFALAVLQTDLFQSSSEAKSRTVAVQLAQEKLEDFRSFETLGTEAGLFAFQDIGDNTGGTLAVDTSTSDGATEVAGVDYSRTWAVLDFYYADTDGDGIENNLVPETDTGNLPSPLPAYPAQKRITVTVAWVDSRGAQQSAVLEGIVGAENPSKTGLVMAGGTGAGGAPPSLYYNPGQAPEVIPTDIGPNKRKETTKPLPDVSQHGSSTVVTFDVISYQTTGNTPFVQRDQFATVSCLCRSNGGTDFAYSASRLEWPDGEDFPTNKGGSVVSKVVGTPADNDQDELCDVCCRDHHDSAAICTPGGPGSPETGIDCYDPWRPTGDYSGGGGDHNHYTAAGDLAGNGDVYLEACRLKRVNGIFRVWQDWRLETLTVLSGDYLTTNSTAYGNYVEDYVDAVVSGGGPPEKPVDPGITLVVGATDQLYTRGVYIDLMTSDFITKVLAKPANERLQYVPFYDVNITKLADWTTSQGLGCVMEGAGDDPDVGCLVSVRSDPIVDEGLLEQTYWRGLVQGEAVGGADAFGYAKYGTSGVTGTAAIDPDDALALNADGSTSSVSVTVPGGTTIGISGTVYKGNKVNKVKDITIAASSGADCSVDVQGQSASFSCDVPVGWTGDVTLSQSGFLFCPGTRSYSDLQDDQPGQHFCIFSSLSSCPVPLPTECGLVP